MNYIARCEQCGVIEEGDFETVGDALEGHEQFHDVSIQRAATDGGEDPETEWRLECMDCDYDDTISGTEHPAEGPPDAVERAVRLHKNTTDESHVVRVKGIHNPEDRDIDPSLLTDGGPHAAGTERFPPEHECQLCRPLNYRGDDINDREGIVTIRREDGGTKTIHCCKRCPDELFGTHNWTSYDDLDGTFGSESRTDGGLYEKYEVYRDGEKVPNCFVLKPESDPAAQQALIRYAEANDVDDELAEDLLQWISDLRSQGDHDNDAETNTGQPSEPVKNVRIAVDSDHLDPTNALHYLVALATEARRYDGHWNGDDEGAAEWAVAQWCQEIGWAPDLRDYDAGEMVDKADDIQHCEAVFDEYVADGGRDRGRYRHQSVDAVRSDAGVGDQDPTCENGNRGCGTPLPCFECLTEGMDDD